MSPIFIYLLKSSLSLAILVLFYELVQKREVFFHFNRIYLLFGIAIALLLPFWNFNVLSVFSTEATSQNYLLTYQVSNFQLPEVVIGGSETTQSGFSLVSLLLCTYLSGVLIKLTLLLFRTMKLITLIGKTKATIINRVKFVFTEGDLPVFSFFNNIFISENTFNSEDSEKIIAHEKVHISQLHSLDLLFAELICIVQWFNPFAYLLKKAIRENHEFLADQQVISAYNDPSTYRLLLLNYSSRIKTNSLAHNFSYSLLKRRLFMTKKPKRRMRLGISVSAASLAFILVLFACSQPDQNLTEDSMDKSIFFSDNVEVLPEYPGGVENLVVFLRSNINYPEKAKEDGTTGSVDVTFIVEKDGSISNVKVKKSLSEECDREAIRVVNSMPDWTPGKQEGKVVRVGLELPIFFSLDYGSKTTVYNSDEINEGDSIFTLVKQMPEFPGGTSALMEYLGANINYPEQAKKDSIQGRVFVNFIVEKDGTIGKVNVLRGVGGGCDEESIRVIKSMPAWTPGRDENGNAVRVSYNIPIKFTLE